MGVPSDLVVVAPSVARAAVPREGESVPGGCGRPTAATRDLLRRATVRRA